MKVFRKIIVASLLISILMLVACGSPSQPVTKSQHDQARQEALDAQAQVAALQREKNQLEAELNAKNAKLEVLLEMERESN